MKCEIVSEIETRALYQMSMGDGERVSNLKILAGQVDFADK
jgi:hypothetical protein